MRPRVRAAVVLSAWLAAAAAEPQPRLERGSTSREAKIEAAREAMKRIRYCALVTVDADGQPRARTIDPFPPAEDMSVWIATLPGTRKLAQIEASPRVTLYYTDPGNGVYVTLMGAAHIREDRESKRKWKHPDVDAFWPDYPDGYVLIEVRPEWLELVTPEIGADETTWRPQSVVFGEPEARGRPPSEKDAFAALDAGRFEAASFLFGRLVETRPDDPNVYYGLGRAREGSSLLEDAARSYRDALRLSPLHRKARFRLGNVLMRLGLADEAERVLTGYEPFRLWDHQVQLLRAMVEGGALTPDDHRGKTLALVNLLLEGNALDEAGRLLAEEASSYADEAPFIVAAARLEASRGALDEARALLAAASAEDPDDADAVWLRAQIDSRQGRAAEALETYERLYAMWPDAPARVRHEIGAAFAMHQRLAEALPHFEAAAALEPELARAQADLALALVRTGEPERAEAHYRLALDAHPDLVAAQQGLASLLLDKGDTAAAIELFRRSVAVAPNDPTARKNLALALHRAGRHQEAEAELSAARALEAERR